MQDNLQQLANFIANKKKDLDFIIPKMRRNRTDDIELREKILNITSDERKKSRSRERGPDKKPRTYRASSMNNLAQFNQRPKEFTKYLKDEKGVDITGNSSIVKAFLIFGGVTSVIFGGLWMYNQYKNRKNKDVKNR